MDEKIRVRPEIPFNGFVKDTLDSGYIEHLDDSELKRLNDLLPWMCFTADAKGRRFGSVAWNGKRDAPQRIPDERIVYMNKLFDLGRHSVLEVGCFEGIHTIALAQLSSTVTAIDSRIENVVKTIVRCNLFGYKPTVTLCDLEKPEDISRLPVVDFVHHVGVLYHLKDPISNLLQLRHIARNGLLLDTHYATPEMASKKYAVEGASYSYYQYGEKGRDEVFSGMYDHAKWLLLDDIKGLLTSIGFSDIRIYKDTEQRNGPRVTLYAARPGVIKQD